jgi:unsaturated chondroitin disaccharide hydrolase
MDRETADRALTAILFRVEKSLLELDGRFPYFSDPDTGKWTTTGDGNWCPGHWICLLWLAAKHSADGGKAEMFRQAAMGYTSKMIQSIEKFRTSIFAGLNCNMAGFEGYDFSGDRSLFGLGFTGADITLNLYNENAQQIASGVYIIEGPPHNLDRDIATKTTMGWVTSGFATSAVDGAHASLPVLLRAYRESGNLRFRDTALSHAEIYLKRFIRDDGSTRQLVRFDPDTGKVLNEYSTLSTAVEGCWARGLGWCISGLAEVWNATCAERYLKAIESVMGFYRTHSNDDMVPYWDMTVPPNSSDLRDTSCAALVAYGMSLLEGGGPRLDTLRNLGTGILDSLVRHYLIFDETSPRHGMLLHGCFSKPKQYAFDNELIWSNYYLAFALDRYITK